jgi:hypothetical protein
MLCVCTLIMWPWTCRRPATCGTNHTNAVGNSAASVNEIVYVWPPTNNISVMYQSMCLV